jgi:glycerophosphoryl diester phosphodiesterase
MLAVTHDPVPGDFAELPRSVPQLKDVVALAAANRMFLDVEVKWRRTSWLDRETLARGVLETLEPIIGRAALRSFDRRILRLAHSIAPSLPLIALTRRSVTRWVEIAATAHARAVSPQFWLVSPRQVRRAHEAGLAVYCWTVNRKRDWRRMLLAGVDGIITDDPAGLVEYLNQATADAGPSNRTSPRS